MCARFPMRHWKTPPVGHGKRAETAPLFDDLIRSVRIDPPLAYQPRLADRYPALAALDWRHWTLAAVIVVLAIALAVAVARQRRQRRSATRASGPRVDTVD